MSIKSWFLRTALGSMLVGGAVKAAVPDYDAFKGTNGIIVTTPGVPPTRIVSINGSALQPGSTILSNLINTGVITNLQAAAGIALGTNNGVIWITNIAAAGGTNTLYQTNGVNVGSAGTLNFDSGVTGYVSGATVILGVSAAGSGDAGGTNARQFGTLVLTNLSGNPIPYTNIIVASTGIALGTNAGITYITNTMNTNAFQPASANLTNWSNIPTGAMANVASVTFLTNWANAVSNYVTAATNSASVTGWIVLRQPATATLSNLSSNPYKDYTNQVFGGTNISVRTVGGTNFIDTIGQLNNWAQYPTGSFVNVAGGTFLTNWVDAVSNYVTAATNSASVTGWIVLRQPASTILSNLSITGAITNLVNASTSGATWLGWIRSTNNGDALLKTVTGSGAITITDQGTNIDINTSGVSGEANVNGEVSLTNNATGIYGLVYDKVGVTNRLKSVSSGNGIVITNNGTNLAIAIDPLVVASQGNLTSASNFLFDWSGAVSNLAQTKQHGSATLTNLSNNPYKDYTNQVFGGTNISVRTAGGTNFIDTIGELNNWSLYPTSAFVNVAGGTFLTNWANAISNYVTAATNTLLVTGYIVFRQPASATLSNLSSNPIKNYTNAITAIYTNGVLVSDSGTNIDFVSGVTGYVAGSSVRLGVNVSGTGGTEVWTNSTATGPAATYRLAFPTNFHVGPQGGIAIGPYVTNYLRFSSLVNTQASIQVYKDITLDPPGSTQFSFAASNGLYLTDYYFDNTGDGSGNAGANLNLYSNAALAAYIQLYPKKNGAVFAMGDFNGTGSGHPSYRIETNGNVAILRGLSGYEWPTLHGVGALTNNASGDLGWFGFQPPSQLLTNLSGTGAVTNVVSLSTTNATSKPLTNSFDGRVLTLRGLEAGANITITANPSNYVIATSGAVGEANVNGEVSVTNAARIGWVYDKQDVTNRLRSAQGGDGIVLTNEGTNVMFAINPAVVASQANLTSASNVLDGTITTASNAVYTLGAWTNNNGVLIPRGNSLIGTGTNTAFIQVLLPNYDTLVKSIYTTRPTNGFGVHAIGQAGQFGEHVAIKGTAGGTTNIAYGVIGTGEPVDNWGTNVGVAGVSIREDPSHSSVVNVGGYFEVGGGGSGANPRLTTAALLLDNRIDPGMNLITARTNNGSSVFEVTGVGGLRVADSLVLSNATPSKVAVFDGNRFVTNSTVDAALLGYLTSQRWTNLIGTGAITNLVNASSNGSTWLGWIRSTNNGDALLKTVTGSGAVVITDQGTNIDISTSGGVGEANVNGEVSLTNNSTGIYGLVYDKVGITNRIKSIASGANIVITNEGTNLVIASTASGGLTGTMLTNLNTADRTNWMILGSALNAVTNGIAADYEKKVLTSGVDRATAILWHSNMLFVGLQDGTSPKFLKFPNPLDLSTYQETNLFADTFHVTASQIMYSQTRGKLLLLFYGSSSLTITEIDPVTLATNDVVINDTTPNDMFAMTTDETNLWVAGFSSSGSLAFSVNQYRLSDWTWIGNLDSEPNLPSSGLGSQWSPIKYDWETGRLYSMNGSNGNVWAWSAPASNMSNFVSRTTLGVPYLVAGADSEIIGNYYYAHGGGQHGTPSAFAGYSPVYRINKTTLEAEIIDLGKISANMLSGMYYDGRYLWFASTTNTTARSSIARLNPVTLEVDHAIVAATNAAFRITGDGTNRLFVAGKNLPGEVYRYQAPIVNAPVVSYYQSILTNGGGIAFSNINERWLSIKSTTGASTNASHFGAATALTIRDGAALTNLNNVGILNITNTAGLNRAVRIWNTNGLGYTELSVITNDWLPTNRLTFSITNPAAGEVLKLQAVSIVNGVADIIITNGTGGGGGAATNADQFAANTTLTLKSGVNLTNIMAWPSNLTGPAIIATATTAQVTNLMEFRGTNGVPRIAVNSNGATLVYARLDWSNNVAFRTNFAFLNLAPYQAFTNALKTNIVLQLTNVEEGVTTRFDAYGAGRLGNGLTNAWNILCTVASGTTIYWPPGVTNGNFDVLVNSNQVVSFTFMGGLGGTNILSAYRVMEGIGSN